MCLDIRFDVFGTSVGLQPLHPFLTFYPFHQPLASPRRAFSTNLQIDRPSLIGYKHHLHTLQARKRQVNAVAKLLRQLDETELQQIQVMRVVSTCAPSLGS